MPSIVPEKRGFDEASFVGNHSYYAKRKRNRWEHGGAPSEGRSTLAQVTITEQYGRRRLSAPRLHPKFTIHRAKWMD
jgi:hypothetical protein